MDFDTLDLGLRALDGGLGLIALRDRSLHACFGAFIIAAALIEGLLRDDLFADEFLPAIEVGFGGRKHGLALIDQRFPASTKACLSLVQIGLRRPQLRLMFRRRNSSDDLSSLDFAAFLDGDVNQAAGIFRGDIDLCGFDAAIRLEDAVGH